MKPSENLMKVLLVGDYPPPYGGVSVHVEVVHQAVRAQGGICEVLDVGKGHLPADGVVPATGPPSHAGRPKSLWASASSLRQRHS